MANKLSLPAAPLHSVHSESKQQCATAEFLRFSCNINAYSQAKKHKHSSSAIIHELSLSTSIFSSLSGPVSLQQPLLHYRKCYSIKNNYSLLLPTSFRSLLQFSIFSPSLYSGSFYLSPLFAFSLPRPFTFALSPPSHPRFSSVLLHYCNSERIVTTDRLAEQRKGSNLDSNPNTKEFRPREIDR